MLGGVDFRHAFSNETKTLLASVLGGHSPDPDLRVAESNVLGAVGILIVPLSVSETLLANNLGGRMSGLGLQLAEPGEMNIITSLDNFNTRCYQKVPSFLCTF